MRLLSRWKVSGWQTLKNGIFCYHVVNISEGESYGDGIYIFLCRNTD